jgi:hypothetical protein
LGGCSQWEGRGYKESVWECDCGGNTVHTYMKTNEACGNYSRDEGRKIKENDGECEFNYNIV